MNETPFYTLDELVNLHQQERLRQPKNKINSSISSSSSSMQFRDVHCYDGKLTSPPDIHIRSFTLEEKQKLFNKLNSILINPRASWMVSRMLSEHELFDPSNKMTPADILATILIRRISVDVFELLEEQLADIAILGQCAQGRSTRLIQILDLTI